MKKLIFILLICALPLLAMVGCDLSNNNLTDGTTPETTTPEDTKPYYNPIPEETTPQVFMPEDTTPSIPEEITTPGDVEITTPDGITETILPEKGEIESPQIEGALDKNSDLVTELLRYLEERLIDYDLLTRPLGERINGIKNGEPAIHVVFDEPDYYFVSGYYNSEHSYEMSSYCCRQKYIWVMYTNETDIQEYCNGIKCQVTFQINRPSSITDIHPGEIAAPEFEHFQLYTPTFENGVNASPAITFEDAFIYLVWQKKDIGKSVIYHCREAYHRDCNNTISCIYLGGKHYIYFLLGIERTGEPLDIEKALSESKIIWNFGDYYDAIISVMDVGKYSIPSGNGLTYHYALISIDDLMNVLLDEVP